MDCKIPSINRRRAGYTLVELMVASTLSVMILITVVAFIFFISQGTMAVSNHLVMESKVQMAADQLSQSLRGVRHLTAYTSNSLSFLDYDSNTVQVVYNPAALTLSMTKTNATTMLLPFCSYLQFTLVQETISAGTFDATNTTTSVTNCRMVLFNWTCSTNVCTGQNSNTNYENMQCAKIVFRNF